MKQNNIPPLAIYTTQKRAISNVYICIFSYHRLVVAIFNMAEVSWLISIKTIY